MVLRAFATQKLPGSDRTELQDPPLRSTRFRDRGLPVEALPRRGHPKHGALRREGQAYDRLVVAIAPAVAADLAVSADLHGFIESVLAFLAV